MFYLTSCRFICIYCYHSGLFATGIRRIKFLVTDKMFHAGRHRQTDKPTTQ